MNKYSLSLGLIFILTSIISNKIFSQDINSCLNIFSSIIFDETNECGKLNVTSDIVDSIKNYECNSVEDCYTEIYMKDFEDSLFFWGITKSIFNNEIESIICVKHDPCCAGNEIYYLWISIKHTSKQLDTMVMYFYTETEIPNIETWKTPLLKETTSNILVRATPKVDDTTEFYDLRQNGNIIDTLKSRTNYYEITNIVNDDKVWYFILLDKTNFITTSNENITKAWMFGWIYDFYNNK